MAVLGNFLEEVKPRCRILRDINSILLQMISKVHDDKQRAVLLSICGASSSTYHTRLSSSAVWCLQISWLKNFWPHIVTLMWIFPQAINQNATICIQLQIPQTSSRSQLLHLLQPWPTKIVRVLRIWWLLSRDVARQTDLWDKQWS